MQLENIRLADFKELKTLDFRKNTKIKSVELEYLTSLT
jgi:hypothetical protein